MNHRDAPDVRLQHDGAVSSREGLESHCFHSVVELRVAHTS